MLELFDSISELVYIVDPETYDILYVNQRGRSRFHIEENCTAKCYKVFQGLDSPCSFCTTGFLEKDKIYTWEYHNPVSDKDYLLKDSLIDWNGKTVRLEVAFDMTKQANEKKKLQNALNSEKMMMHCLRQLHKENDLKKGIDGMLRQLGRELSAERAYIFQIDGSRMSNTYEWCQEGITPQIDNLQDMEVWLVDRWKRYFKRGECVTIEDIEEIRESSPDEYGKLIVQDIKSLAVAPLEKNGKLLGFLGVDNPPAEKIVNISAFLNTLCYFLINIFYLMDDEDKLRQIGFCDSLTGLWNRTRYMADIDAMKGDEGSLGILFMDLNGLKRINDIGGHAEGDKALITCANVLRTVFATENIYRIGGDEFVVMCKDMEESELHQKVVQIRYKFEYDFSYYVAIGTSWSKQCGDIEEMLLHSDEEMYRDKRRFYRTHSESSRYRSFDEESSFSKDNPLLKEYNMLMSSLQVSVSKHMLEENFSLIWANDCFYKLAGGTKEEYEKLYGSNWKAFYVNDADEYDRVFQIVMEAYDSGKSGFETLAKMPRPDVGYQWINIVGTFTDEKINGISVVYVVLTDVTDLIRMQKEQGVAYDNLPGFVTKIQITEDGPRLLYANQQFKEFFGEEDNANYSRLLKENIEANELIIKQNYETLKKGLPFSFEVKVHGDGGSEAYFQICGDCVDWVQQMPVYLGIFIDTTESTSQKAMLREFAFVDPVTGGRNKTSFDIDAGRAVASAPAGTYVLASMDVLKFKLINDVFGIDKGDLTLKYIYNKILAHLKPDEYAARLSSDIFHILLYAEEPENLEIRIADIAADINQFNKGQENKYIINMVAGIYYVGEPSLPITRMQDRANNARKKGKEGILGAKLCECRYYDDNDNLFLAKEKNIENRMRDALKKEEFAVYLQPKQELKTQRVMGAEALVRWIDPVRGIISPIDFIPLFEKTGFIVDMDLYVFEKVCKLLRTWLDQGIEPIQISVNMSRVHLSNPHFLDRYEEIRKRHGIDAGLLEIELTETMVFENPQLLSKIIEDIKHCGYRCSMDDFGSGYSSLNVLKDIRVDTLKLDKAFFASADLDDPWEAAIISGVIELARKLQMKTVAEGIETENQAKFLKTVDCDMIQGYLFSRPIPVEDFEALVFGK